MNKSGITKSIVFGGSGFIGTRLVRKLALGEEGVRSVDIAPERARYEGAIYDYGDVRSPLPATLCSGAEIIYNLAAVHRTPGHPPHEYYATNIGGALAVTALADACGIKTIVFTSSISVYGPSEELIVESSDLRPTSDYGRSKLLAEEIHRQWQARGEGRRLIVVRPGVVFGPGEGGNYSTLAKALGRGVFAYPGRRDTIKSGGYVDELLRAIDFALSCRKPEVTFNFAYPDASTTENIVHAFGRVAGFKTQYPTLPIPPLLIAARGFELLNSIGVRNPIHRERVWKLVRSTRIAPQWLLQNGYVFGTDLEAALADWRSETQGSFT